MLWRRKDKIKYVLKGFFEHEVSKSTWIAFNEGGYVKEVRVRLLKAPTSEDKRTIVELVGVLTPGGSSLMLRLDPPLES